MAVMLILRMKMSDHDESEKVEGDVNLLDSSTPEFRSLRLLRT